MSRVDVDADDEGRRGKSNGSWGGIRDVIAGARATWRGGGGVVSRMCVDRCRLWGGTRRDAAGRGGTRRVDGSFVMLLQDVFHPGHVTRVVFAIFHQREGDVRDGHGE